MEIGFAKISPAGNMTVIVLDPLPRRVYREVAGRIMCSGGLGAEQVGFIEPSQDPRAVAGLHMMGGEFCGNASRAFGAWLAFRGYPGVRWVGSLASVPIEVSGCDEVLVIRVSVGPEGRPVWAASPMPVPHGIRSVRCREHETVLVEFPGISHAVVWGEEATPEAFREVAAACGAESVPALGVMFFNENKAEVVPLVAVHGTGSLVWEGSCASGSLAVACALAARDGRSQGNLRLRHPGGELVVCADWNGKVVSAEVSGSVEIVAVGTAWLKSTGAV